MASALQRASAIMASGTMVSRILGFAKTMLLVYAIGNTLTLSGDAFANGNQLPNTIYMALAGGMLNAVLVPQIVKAAQGADGGRAYINKVLTLVSVALLAITTIVMIAAPSVVWLFTMAWEPEQRALAIAFAYWCLPQIVFYGWYTMLGEVLNAKKIFGPFTWSPALANVIAIIGTILFIVMFGADPDGNRAVTDWSPGAIGVLAGSATLGVVAQALILIVPWRKAGLSFKPDFRWRGVGLGQTGRLAGWGLASVTVLQLGGIVTSNIVNSASGEGPSLLAMNNAWLVFMLPHSVIAVSLMTAYFTQLAEHGQSGQLANYRDTFSSAARQVLLLMIFASVALFICAGYVSRVMLFGASADQVDSFADLLRAYSLGLAAYSMMFVIQRAFYALSDARTPFFFMSGQLVLLIVLTVPVGLVIDKALLGFAYALIWSGTTILQAIVAFWLLRRKVGGMGGRDLAASGTKNILAAIPAAVLGILVLALLANLLPASEGGVAIVRAIVEALVVTGIMGVAYFGVLLLLKSPEAHAVLRRVLKR
ncbi:murein biosynthesis integral membrane protein MurJ [Leucobacter aridicollis]|uniref:Putative peptidoglycan lipid II flippase n=1 Tax=Leucobacter aridicollis TaxID=283878 RepID=A0A852RAA4_9MICO|nr:murein biosynthesis integral membrane protein MurJ [Leucobacter aridicollis]MBL3681634.1 murein biosynthesis integral membrane protein MurJ [Leucobacter aridicollis]NYD27329.1 putative peptidoglycan lipid II flippase [Leucobacter aridicollis]